MGFRNIEPLPAPEPEPVAKHECSLPGDPNVGPGTRFSCDSCGKTFVWAPEEARGWQVFTFPFGYLIRLILIVGLVGLSLVRGDGWRSQAQLFVFGFLNWGIFLFIAVGAFIG